MTDEEIIRMARKAGINFEPATESDDGIDTWYGHQYLPNGAMQLLISIAQAEEREACAAVAEEHETWRDNPASNIAEAIRERSNVKLRGAPLLARPSRTPC